MPPTGCRPNRCSRSCANAGGHVLKPTCRSWHPYSTTCTPLTGPDTTECGTSITATRFPASLSTCQKGVPAVSRGLVAAVLVRAECQLLVAVITVFRRGQRREQRRPDRTLVYADRRRRADHAAASESAAIVGARPSAANARMTRSSHASRATMRTLGADVISPSLRLRRARLPGGRAFDTLEGTRSSYPADPVSRWERTCCTSRRRPGVRAGRARLAMRNSRSQSS